MKQLSQAQVIAVADELNESIRNWRLIDQGGGKFVVFKIPDAVGSNISSPDEGETMLFWRFDRRHAAEKFRTRRMVIELAKLAEAVA